jgi:uncharacterized protein YfaT (DUF1175 family)
MLNNRLPALSYTYIRRSCSNMIPGELIFSDHYDTVHLSSLLGRVDIKFFNEISTSQTPIAPGELFYRQVLQDLGITFSDLDLGVRYSVIELW